ncbi:MAG: hypothetical protein HEQ20_10380 [Aphanizomenon flos-aquae KM1D3_PB]|nr:hypothetical protein [Aphanizomenon sp. UHCC 0183]QSV71085.1 MAG: hypothetical protein HEQ20_10380 [Aphanizomenon flos-aquae KM1D3_PB]
MALKIIVIARQEARGKSKEVFSDFTFLYTVWFYCVHLLSCVNLIIREMMIITRITAKPT